MEEVPKRRTSWCRQGLTFRARRSCGKFSLCPLLELLGLDEVFKDDAPLGGLALCPLYLLLHVDVLHVHLLLGEPLDSRHFTKVFLSVLVREGIGGLWTLVIMED